MIKGVHSHVNTVHKIVKDHEIEREEELSEGQDVESRGRRFQRKRDRDQSASRSYSKIKVGLQSMKNLLK